MKRGLIFPVIYDTDFSTFFFAGTIRDLQVVFSHITAGRFPVWLIVIKSVHSNQHRLNFHYSLVRGSTEKDQIKGVSWDALRGTDLIVG